MTAILTTAPAKEKKKKYPFFREVQQELSKVSWTTKEEIQLCTKVVVFSTFAFGLAIYLTDLALRGVLNLIFLIGRGIGG